MPAQPSSADTIAPSVTGSSLEPDMPDLGLLDAGLPVLLLPLRIETVFDRATTPARLNIRAYPDEVWANTHARTLTAEEAQAARNYWREHWRGTQPAGGADADWPDQRLGPYVRLFARLNQTTQAAELVDLPGLGDARSQILLSHRPLGGYQRIAELLALPDLSYGVLQMLLEAHAESSAERATVAADVAMLARVPEPELLTITGWPLPVRQQLLGFLAHASISELDAVSGLGPRTALALVVARQSGPFSSLLDVAAVPGIGVARLTDLLTHAAALPATHASAANAAQDALARQFGAGRASWALHQMRPRNPPGPGVIPDFPDWEEGRSSTATVATILPEQLVAQGFKNGTSLFEFAGQPIPAQLKLGPDFDTAEGFSNTDGGALAIDEGMRWMVDFDAALDVGMALSIPLDGDRAGVLDGLDQLLVYGVAAHTPPAAQAAGLAQLFESHHFTRGLELLPQGTPTNNTRAARAGTASGSPASSAPTGTGGDTSVLAMALGLDSTAVFDPLPGARGAERAGTRAMNRLLWSGLVEPQLRWLLAEESGASLIPETARQWLSDFFCDTLSGAGPLPALQIGRQPLGILPVTRPATFQHANELEALLKVLERLRGRWQDAASSQPQLHPDRLEERAGDDDEPGDILNATLLELLGNAPHPVDLRLSALEYRRRDQGSALGIAARYHVLRLICWAARNNNFTDWQADFPASVDDDDYADIEQQRAVWEQRRETFDALMAAEFAAAQAANPGAPDLTRWQSMLTLRQSALVRIETLLAVHQRRVDQLRAAHAGRTPAGVVGVDAPRALYSVFDDQEPARIGWSDVLADDRANWLQLLIDHCHAGMSLPQNDGGAPTLFQRIARTAVDRVLSTGLPGPINSLRSALEQLAALSPEQLQLRLRESLGLAGPRLDAWFTGVATARLQQLRDHRADGLYVGAWGLVEDLYPDEEDNDSHGFVHAPSLAHAATAAILRAGWLAGGSGDVLSPAATDLSGPRLRLANTLLQGLRQGADYGQLLGSRFERQLHRHNSAAAIAPIRAAVGNTGTATSGSIVDGEQLLAEQDSDAVRAAVDAAAAAHQSPAELRAGVAQALTYISQAADAVADLILAEGVFQIVSGRPNAAGASLESLSGALRVPPEPGILGNPARGPLVSHRIAWIWPGADPGPDGWSGDDHWLSGWYARVLGPASQYQFAWQWSGPDPDTVTVHVGSLADLDLSARQLVDLAPGPTQLVSNALAEHIRQHLQGADDAVSADGQLDPEFANHGFVSLADLGVTLHLLAGIGASARPLRAADLRDPLLDPVERSTSAEELEWTPGLAAQRAVSSARSASETAVLGWMEQQSLWRPKLAELLELAALQDARPGAGSPEVCVAQWPNDASATTPEGWAALQRPDAGGRACTVLLGADQLAVDARLYGLVIDEWSERLPADEIDTAVAFHVDSPAARAPQTALLAVCPPHAQWSHNQLALTIREAISLANIRPVSLGDIEGVGHWLPFTFLPEDGS